MKYAWIFLFLAAWPITLICEVLNVSVSGYFEHQRRLAQARPSGPGGRHGNEELLAHIRAIHAEVKGEYGWPRVWKELLARGIRVGKDRVQRLMQTHGIKARGKRKFVVTSDSKHSLPVAENLLARDLKKCNRQHLVVPVDATDMYYAVINSKSCKLTSLGKHYRRLAEKEQD